MTGMRRPPRLASSMDPGKALHHIANMAPASHGAGHRCAQCETMIQTAREAIDAPPLPAPYLRTVASVRAYVARWVVVSGQGRWPRGVCRGCGSDRWTEEPRCRHCGRRRRGLIEALHRLLDIVTPQRCTHCPAWGTRWSIRWHRMNTAYCDERSNFACTCAPCRDALDDHWTERWAEVNDDIRRSLLP